MSEAVGPVATGVAPVGLVVGELGSLLTKPTGLRPAPRVGAVDVSALDAEVRLSNLPSGARLVTDPMEHTRSVSIACFVGIGSRDEPAELAGASHFLEHLLFKGTCRRTAREINRSIDALGGDFNAYTVRESTVFYVRVPAPHGDFAADLLCEVIASPRFDPEDFEIERNVILGELDGALDSPDDVVFMNLAEAMFPGHPLGRETLGDRASLAAIGVEEIAAFHDRWYRPANLVFAAAGDVAHDAIGTIIEAHFGERPAGDRPVRVPPTGAMVATSAEERPIEQAHLALGWRGLTSADPDRIALAIANHALGDGPSSRLHEEIRERRGLAYAVSSSASGNLDCGSQFVYCATAPEHFGTVADLVDETITEMLSDGIDDEELTVAKGYMAGSLLMALEDSSSRMSRAGTAVLNHGRTIPVAESLERIDATTRDDVHRVVGRVFGGERVTSVVGPDSSTAVQGSFSQ